MPPLSMMKLRSFWCGPKFTLRNVHSSLISEASKSHPISITFHLMFYGLLCSLPRSSLTVLIHFFLFERKMILLCVRSGNEAAGFDDTHLSGQQSNYILTFLLFFLPFFLIFCHLRAQSFDTHTHKMSKGWWWRNFSSPFSALLWNVCLLCRLLRPLMEMKMVELESDEYVPACVHVCSKIDASMSTRNLFKLQPKVEVIEHVLKTESTSSDSKLSALL